MNLLNALKLLKLGLKVNDNELKLILSFEFTQNAFFKYKILILVIKKKD